MQIEEPLAELRRVYFVVRDDNGDLVADAATGAPAGTIKTSSNGTALTNAAGTFAAVGGGLHYYEATEAEAAIPGFLWVMFTKTGCQRADPWTTVGTIFGFEEEDTTLLRLPILIFDENGDPTTESVEINNMVEYDTTLIHKSTNGGAFSLANGSIVEVGSGLHYYQGVVADAATLGFIAIKVTPVTNPDEDEYPEQIAYTPVSTAATGGASGTIISIKGSTARWTPVTALIEIESGSMWVMLFVGNNWTTIYDPIEGWVPWFAQRSSVEPSGDYFEVAILPNGGWSSEEFDLKFVSGAEMLIAEE